MSPEPRIELLSSKKLIGKSVRMSLAEDKTGDLWKDVMSNVIQENSITLAPRYSVQLYEPGYFKKFDQSTMFTKWACMEIVELKNIPNSFETFDLPGGLYAVFDFKGASSDFSKMAQYIYGQWLPNSEYELDHRPHFELLGNNYQNNHRDSEEEVWIPIKNRSIQNKG